MKRRSRVCDVIIAFFIFGQAPFVSFAQTINALPVAMVRCEKLFSDLRKEGKLEDPELKELLDFRRASLTAAPSIATALANEESRIISELLTAGISNHDISKILTSGLPVALPSPISAKFTQAHTIDEEDLRPWAPLSVISVQSGNIQNAFFSPSGKYLLVYSKHELALFDRDGTLIKRYQNSEISIQRALFFADESGLYLIAETTIDSEAKGIFEVFDLELTKIDFWVKQSYMERVHSIHPNRESHLARNLGPRYDRAQKRFIEENVSLLSTRTNPSVQRLKGENIDVHRDLNLSADLFGSETFRIPTFDPEENAVHLYDSYGRKYSFANARQGGQLFMMINEVAIATDGDQILAWDLADGGLLYWRNKADRQRIYVSGRIILQTVYFKPDGFVAVVLERPRYEGDKWRVFLVTENGKVSDQPILESDNCINTRLFKNEKHILVYYRFDDRQPTNPVPLTKIIDTQGRHVVTLKSSIGSETATPQISSDEQRILTISGGTAQIWRPNPIFARPNAEKSEPQEAP